MSFWDQIQESVHICCVGEAVIPNLAPVLDCRFKTKAVVLVHTEQFKPQAYYLSDVYKMYQIKTMFYLVSSAFDIGKLQQELSRLLCEEAGICFGGRELFVNVTGGTKPMSLVLYEQASLLEFFIYYMNRDDSISLLSPWQEDRGEKNIFYLEDRIKLKFFLKAHGLQLVSNHIPYSKGNIREFLDKMIENIGVYCKVIPCLNYYAATAADRPDLLSDALSLSNLEKLKELLCLLSETGLLTLEGRCLRFKDEQARFFVNGGWLEEFVCHQVKQLSSELPQIQDYLSGAKILDERRNIKNEMDGLILYDNNLCMIECKTKKIEGSDSADIVYKVDSLMHTLGGSLAKGLVVSVFPFSRSSLERAQKNHIKVIMGEEIKRFKQHLRLWLESGQCIR